MNASERRKRRELLARLYGKRCHWCGHALALPGRRRQISQAGPPEGRRWATLDHVFPAGRGGGNQLENLVLACVECNHSRGCPKPGSKRFDFKPWEAA